MTVAEILTLAGSHVDETVDPVDGLAWLNEALTELGVNANLFTTTSITAEAQTFYPLPANALDVVEVLNSNGKIYLDYDVRAGNIRFADADTYQVTCRRLATGVTSVNDTPEVHPMFHPALALFVASRLKSSLQDSDAARQLMSEFLAKVADVVKTLRRQARRSTKITVIRGG